MIVVTICHRTQIGVITAMRVEETEQQPRRVRRLRWKGPRDARATRPTRAAGPTRGFGGVAARKGLRERRASEQARCSGHAPERDAVTLLLLTSIHISWLLKLGIVSVMLEIYTCDIFMIVDGRIILIFWGGRRPGPAGRRVTNSRPERLFCIGNC